MPPGPSVSAEGMNPAADIAKTEAVKALGLAPEAKNLFQAEPVMNQKLNAFGGKEESAISLADNDSLNVRQSFLGMISSGGETFGVVRVSDTAGNDVDGKPSVKTMLTILPKPEDGPDARARIVGEVPAKGFLPVGRSHQPQLSMSQGVSRDAFFLHLDESGVVSMVDVKSTNPVTIIKPKGVIPEGQAESLAWSIKSREAKEILSPRTSDTVPRLGNVGMSREVQYVPVGSEVPATPPLPNANQIVAPFGTDNGGAGWWDQSVRVPAAESRFAPPPTVDAASVRPQVESVATPKASEVLKEVYDQDFINLAKNNERLYKKLSDMTSSLLGTGNLQRDPSAVQRLIGNIRASGAGGTEAILKRLNQKNFGLDNASKNNPAEALRSVAYLVQDAASYVTQNARHMNDVMYRMQGGAGVLGEEFEGAQHIVDTAFRAAFKSAQLDPQTKAAMLASFSS